MREIQGIISFIQHMAFADKLLAKLIVNHYIKCIAFFCRDIQLYDVFCRIRV